MLGWCGRGEQSLGLGSIPCSLLNQENEHLKKFQVTWELHNKHLFENLVFSEPLLQSTLPALLSQIRYLVLVTCLGICVSPAPRVGSARPAQWGGNSPATLHRLNRAA